MSSSVAVVTSPGAAASTAAPLSRPVSRRGVLAAFCGAVLVATVARRGTHGSPAAQPAAAQPAAWPSPPSYHGIVGML